MTHHEKKGSFLVRILKMGRLGHIAPGSCTPAETGFAEVGPLSTNLASGQQRIFLILFFHPLLRWLLAIMIIGYK